MAKASTSTEDIPTDNKESTTLLWFDPNIGTREDTFKTKQNLRRINNYVKFYTDLEECVTYIQSIAHEKILFITSGSKAPSILSKVSSYRQIDSIFIFSVKEEKYQDLIHKYEKIVEVYVNLNELCQSIEEQMDLVDKQIQTFTFFNQREKSMKDLSEESGAFLWYQLFNYVIQRFPRNDHAKKQMIDMCEQYYRGNPKQLKLINQFEREYRSSDAIRWYTKQSFLFRLINKAFRIEDFHLLYTFRFFIADLTQALQYEHHKILASEQNLITVYRGSKLGKEEFEKFKQNRSQLISTNGYLSTSRLQSVALAFARKPTKRTDIVSVLFQIKCHIQEIGKNIVCGDIASFSEYPVEQELLFGLNACFQIESIEQEQSIQVITMNLSNQGEIITKSFLEQTQKETDEQDLPWIQFNIGRALDFKGKFKEARQFYDQAYQRMINTRPPRVKDSAYVLNNIGVNLVDQGHLDDALHYHQQALKIRKEYYPSGHADIARSLDNIGRILRRQRKYNQAFDYHQQALKMREKYYTSDHIDIARSFNNIGKVLDDLERYDVALDYYQRALKMREKYFPSSHIYVAHTLSDIGTSYQHMNNTSLALEYYNRALTIYEKFLPDGSPDRVQTEEKIKKIMKKLKTHSMITFF